MSRPDDGPHAAPSWFEEHLLSDILPHWLASAPTESGLFIPQLDRQWQRKPERYGTLVSQSRLLYNFSVGYELTADEQYAKAVERGAQFLIGTLRDGTYGGWLWSCAEDGAILDDAKDSYGHAFVVFGLAHAGRCLGDDAYKQAAREACRALMGPLRDVHGGLIPRMSRDFSRRLDRARLANSQNPMMHFFEALLALGDACGLSAMYDAARSVADFLLSRPGREPRGGLPELYGPDWSALPTRQGGRIDIGHQFEWAFLLSAAVERGFPDSYLAEAEALLEYGLRVGYDAEEGGIFADASLEGDVIERSKGWWQQCEAARALMHFVERRGRRDLLAPLEGTVAFFRRDLVDPEYGGWYAGRSRDKGSAWKVDYHVVGMCVEAMRLRDLRRAAGEADADGA